MTRPAAFTSLVCLAAMAACSPSLDWREFMAEGVGVVATFPCRPDRHARAVRLGGATTQMQMLVCSAAGATFALSFVDIADPARVAPTLGELCGIAVENVRGEQPLFAPWQVSGMTPNAQAKRMSVTGRLPDGTEVRLQAVFFAHALRLYQATVIGAAPNEAAVQTFLAGFRFPA